MTPGRREKRRGHGRLGRERNCTANPKKIHANKNSHTKPQSREESWRSRLSLGTRLIPEALVVLDGGHFQSQIFQKKTDPPVFVLPAVLGCQRNDHQTHPKPPRPCGDILLILKFEFTETAHSRLKLGRRRSVALQGFARIRGGLFGGCLIVRGIDHRGHREHGDSGQIA